MSLQASLFPTPLTRKSRIDLYQIRTWERRGNKLTESPTTTLTPLFPGGVALLRCCRIFFPNACTAVVGGVIGDLMCLSRRFGMVLVLGFRGIEGGMGMGWVLSAKNRREMNGDSDVSQDFLEGCQSLWIGLAGTLYLFCTPEVQRERASSVLGC